MKRFLGLLIIIVIGIFVFLNRQNIPRPAVLSDRNVQSDSQKVTPKSIEAVESVFVTYWTLNSESSLEGYNSAYYFGVEANEQGINKDEIGFSRINAFLEKTKHIPNRFLVVRMVDKEVNSEVLKDVQAQKRIADESVAIANEYGFDGIVLDFEISSISFGAVTDRVTAFYTTASKVTKNNNLQFYVTLYGDTYYRVRAYDVKKIGDLADRVLIMSYDFHKSRGNPGPNFPMSGKEEYGYDFQKMISDFSNDVDIEKLEIIFGMFGYDWEVDDEGKATEYGDALSTQEITLSYIDDCSQARCEWKRDLQSQEVVILYETTDGTKHTVWMEDRESAKRKKEYIQNKGISKVSYWAYSYFKK
ncbi:MAG TPA: glycosyl hydrolase family 18 protein [Candidatus Levybacteria bacterium]|nr:glycosyl hydrolase family 18 protein [Candidatus Levybacteria bacterium]